MLAIHGTPMSSLVNAAKLLTGRHALVAHETAGSFADIAAAVCQSFVADNSAFSMWRAGRPATDWTECYRWYEGLMRFPNFDWALIPDVIDGTEEDNDRLIAEWPFGKFLGVPVWHYGESLERLARLVSEWPRVALGSSGQWPTPGTPSWWRRTDEVMRVACDADGYPRCKLHGLRMLNPSVFTRMPLASADSCNAGRNCGDEGKRLNVPPDAAAELIIRRIEQHNAAARWDLLPAAVFGDQPGLFEDVAA